MVAMLAACGDEITVVTPTAPIPMPPLIGGGWQAVVSSSTVPTAVWTITLLQEQSAAFGAWADDVNDYTGTATFSVTPDNLIIGTMTIRTVASCTMSIASCGACVGSTSLRGTVSNDATRMEWTSPGWRECPGTPVQVVLDWRRR